MMTSIICPVVLVNMGFIIVGSTIEITIASSQGMKIMIIPWSRPWDDRLRILARTRFRDRIVSPIFTSRSDRTPPVSWAILIAFTVMSRSSDLMRLFMSSRAWVIGLPTRFSCSAWANSCRMGGPISRVTCSMARIRLIPAFIAPASIGIASSSWASNFFRRCCSMALR